MSGWLSVSVLPLLAVALAAALLEQLLPEGPSSRLVGSLRLITGLCVLLALSAPLREGILFLQSLSSGDAETAAERLNEYGQSLYGGVTAPDAVLDDTLSASGADGIEAWLRGELCDRFGIPASDCRVQADVIVRVGSGTDTEVCVRSVSIVLSGRAIFQNPHLIEEWVHDQLGCDCHISVG